MYKSEDEICHAAIEAISKILEKDKAGKITMNDDSIMIGSRFDRLSRIAGVIDLVEELTKDEEQKA